MTTYTPVIFDIPTGLDEVGYLVGLPRLPKEPSSQYRMRLLSFVRNRPRPDSAWYYSQVSNLLGLKSLNVIDINLRLDSDGLPLAQDPRIEVTATDLILWSNYRENEVDKQINLVTDKRTLQLLRAEIHASTYFSCSTLDSSYNRLLSKNLRISNSDGWVSREFFSQRKVHKFKYPYIVSFWPDIEGLFMTQVESMSNVDDYGKYYFDSIAGVIHSYQVLNGSTKYQYRDFPFRLWWDPVRVTSLVDTDANKLLRESVRGETGALEYNGGTTELGVSVYKELLNVYPLEWGK